MLLDEEKNERYSRNTSIQDIGIDGQIKLLGSKILIAGAGGLGSTVISNLASVGIGTIGIVDNDCVELSNLNRQYIHSYKNIGKHKVDSAKEWINNFNADVKVNTYQIRLDENNCGEILKGYDVIIDCFDSFESKFMLNKVCVKNRKILVHGGVTGFSGQVMTIISDKTACLNCVFPKPDISSFVTKGVISPAVSLIASIQAMETVKVLLNFNKLLANCILSYDGVEQTVKKIKTDKNANCPVCGNVVKINDK